MEASWSLQVAQNTETALLWYTKRLSVIGRVWTRMYLSICAQHSDLLCKMLITMTKWVQRS